MPVHPFYRAITESSARFRALLPRARAVQRERLQSIVSRNADTRFGRAHGFATIESPRAYADCVPARNYEDFAGYVDEIAAGAPGVLTQEPVVALEPTGGSTAGSKLVPVTQSLLAS